MNYLKYYCLEKYLFDDVRVRFHREGVIDPIDFYMILIWKANRAKNRARDRLAHEAGSFSKAVEQIGAELHNAKGAKERLGALMSARWKFRLATATAILTVLYPEEFTIYDKRVLDELPRFKQLGEKPFSGAMWEQYCDFKRAVEACTPAELCLRDKDRFLWGKSSYREAQKASGANFR
jgi:hypothetical protein